MTFQNKVALITGSSQGIGKATAKEFAKLGAKIVLNGRNAERVNLAVEELKASGADVIGVVGDVAVAEQARHLLDKTLEQFGRLDILVNNAGVSMRGDFAELKPDVFNQVFNTNVIGVTNLTIPAMVHLKANKGSLIFISSLAGIRGLPGLSAYCSSKMALRAIAESIRIEEAESGLHVGLIQVGITEIEHAKQTVGPDGKLMTINDRSKFKVMPMENVAQAIVKNIKKRKFVTTLTGIGKLNATMQSVLPGLVEKVLIRSIDKIKKRS